MAEPTSDYEVDGGSESEDATDDSEGSLSDDPAGDPEEYYSSKEFYDARFDEGVQDIISDYAPPLVYTKDPFEDGVRLPGPTPQWSTLPPEIQDAIVDAAWKLSRVRAHWDASRNLRATLLGVSRAWARRARRFLLEDADVHTPKSLAWYLEVIQAEREGRLCLPFCELVRTLSVSWELGKEKDDVADDDGDEAGAAADIDADEDEVLGREIRSTLFQDDLATMVHAFTNLSHLHIVSYDMQDGLTASLQRSLGTAASIAKITIDATSSDPVDVAPIFHTLATVKGLRELRFDWYDTDTHTLSTLSKLQTVTTLFHGGSIDHASYLHMMESFPALVCLNLMGSNLPHGAILASIARLSLQLESLSLMLNYWGRHDTTTVRAVTREVFTPLLAISFPALKKLHLSTKTLPGDVVARLIQADIPRLEDLVLHTRTLQIGTRSVRMLVRDGGFRRLARVDVKSIWAWDDSHSRYQRLRTIAWCARRGVELLLEAFEY